MKLKYRGTLVFNNMVQFLKRDGEPELVDVEIDTEQEYGGEDEYQTN
jgi:hypothetical protein